MVARHFLQMLCPHRSVIGARRLAANSFVQIGQIKNSVHDGA